VSCPAEQVTGYVDGALDDATRARIEAHLAECAACRAQADFERGVRARLRALPGPEPRPGFEDDVRRHLAAGRPRRWRWALPLAAGLAAIALWGRSAAPFVAVELALDHAKCFSFERLPAEVWGGEPAVLAQWFEDRGTELPPLPSAVGGLTLLGGRYCPLLDRRAAHLYYTADGRHVSVYVVPGRLYGGDGFDRRVAGRHVRLMQVTGAHVGIVGEHRDDVRALEGSLTRTVATLLRPRPPRR
jgi:anti-sigma factor RsiW